MNKRFKNLCFLVFAAATVQAQNYQFVREIGGAPAGSIQFSTPKGIDIDPYGIVYVSDQGNNRIQKFTNSGTFLSQWGTLGAGNGQLNAPRGIAFDQSGNIVVCDYGNFRVQKLTADGVFITQWGDSGSVAGQFNQPTSVDIDLNGNIFVSDFGNNRIQKFDANGNFLLQWGTLGAGNSQFSGPIGVVVDGTGNVFVADQSNNRIQKFDNMGNYLLEWGTAGSIDGRFNSPVGLAVDAVGNVYVTDYYNQRVQKFNGSGAFLFKWGSIGTGNGQFEAPKSLTVDPFGNVYVTDLVNNNVQKFDNAGNFIVKWGASAATSQLRQPYGLAIGSNGQLFVADYGNSRIVKYDSKGTFLSAWGSYGNLTGEFNGPVDVAVDASGNVFETDYGGNRVQKFTNEGVFVNQWGNTGASNGQFNGPIGINLDAVGNIYVADANNNRVQKFSGSGNYLDQWGSAGAGPGQFSSPAGIAFDALGNIYVTDALNNRVQKFDNAGTFITTWGTPGNGDGEFNIPFAIAVDANNLVYVTDNQNNRVQVFNSSGTYLTQWGTAGGGHGQFNSPQGIRIDANGSIYVADWSNNRIQVFSSVSTWNGASWDYLPQPGNSLVIAGNLNATSANLNGLTEFNNITVNFSATLTIPANSELKVNGDFVADGTVIVTPAGALILGVGSSFTGNVQVQQNGSSNAAVYNYWSSPVQSYNLDLLPGKNKYAFNTTTNSWDPAFGSMVPGKGYIATGSGLTTFTGKPNLDTILYPVTHVGSSFNLVGNPYPAGIRWAQLFTGNTSNQALITGSIWLWDQASNSTYGSGDYAVYNGVGGVAGGGGHTPNGNIATCQGFFVQAVTSGSLQFTPAMQQSGNTHFFRMEDAVPERLSLDIQGPNKDFNQTLIAFLPDATDGFDVAYDAPKQKGNPNLSFASVLNGQPYAIQALSPLKGSKTVQLILDAGVSGNYTLSKDTMENIPDQYDVYLEDKETSTLINLRTTSSYETTILSGTGQLRFLIHFVESTVTAIEDLQAMIGDISIYSYHNEVHVNMGKKTASKIEMVNLNGQTIKSVAGVGSGHVTIPMKEYKGIFMVRVYAEDEVRTSKVVLE